MSRFASPGAASSGSFVSGRRRPGRPRIQSRRTTLSDGSLSVSTIRYRRSAMSQLRLDPLTGRWVVISLDRLRTPVGLRPPHPSGGGRSATACPFCPGHEERRPPALETYGPGGGWLVRVVPNLFPAFAGNEPMVVDHLGPVFTQAPASGIHEVLVLTPDHNATWADLTDAARRAGHGRHPRPHRRARRRARAALQPGHRQRRPGGGRIARAPARPAAGHVVRPPRRSPTSRPVSPASRAAACCARRSRPRRRSGTASCWPTSTSSSSARTGARRPTRCWSSPGPTRPTCNGDAHPT